MSRSSKRLGLALVAAAAAASTALVSPAYASTGHGFGHGRPAADSTRYYTPKPDTDALKQVASLLAQHDLKDAALIGTMITTPQAVWFNGGTPSEVQRDVRTTVLKAAAQRSVPVLVAYNVPFRDCSQYSAGGATSKAAYEAWIDGFARGLGNSAASVILEPDGLGIIPFHTNLDGSQDWCKPAEADPATAESDRFAMLNYAVEALKAHPNVKVYLDGTHPAWLNVGEAASRLVQAGVEKADGFFLNVSNYQYTANSTFYGTWISDCIAYVTQLGGSFTGCPNQYWNGGPDGTKIAELLGAWQGGALSNYGEWSDTSDEPTLNTSGINSRYAAMLGSTVPAAHFVVDTSRNGQGPWNTATVSYPDPQDWCNPPGRGLGPRPEATPVADNAQLDAYLWIKIPGASDGQCTRGTAGPEDPARGIVDPAAGAWFPQMALELVHNAVPALLPEWPQHG